MIFGPLSSLLIIPLARPALYFLKQEKVPEKEAGNNEDIRDRLQRYKLFIILFNCYILLVIKFYSVKFHVVPR